MYFKFTCLYNNFYIFIYFFSEKPIKTEFKDEPDFDSVDEDDQKLVIKEENDIKEEAEMNVSQASSCDYSMSQFKDEPKYDDEEEEEYQNESHSQIKQEEESEEDVPLVRF